MQYTNNTMYYSDNLPVVRRWQIKKAIDILLLVAVHIHVLVPYFKIHSLRNCGNKMDYVYIFGIHRRNVLPKL